MRVPKKEVWNGDYKCIDVDCDRNIPANVVKKQFTHPRNRVCVRCKSHSSIRWKCVACNTIISSSHKRIGTFYCSSPCRWNANFKRTYAPKVRAKKYDIRKCIYCTKRLTHKHAMKFCNSYCYRNNRMLEKHRLLLKNNVNLRSKLRYAVRHPREAKDKYESRKEYFRQYQTRHRNVKKLVAKIRARQTHK